MRRLAPVSREVLASGVIGVFVASLLLALGAHAIHVAPAPERSGAGAESSVGLRALLGAGDGQAYAAIARDPTLARPQALASKPEFAYRAQRPLFGEAGWLVSLGDPNLVPLALGALDALAAGLVVIALGALLARADIPPRYALGIFAIPGAIGIVWGMTPELLELAFITAGVLGWTAKPKPKIAFAVTAFTFAALTRESMLLVPLALMVLALKTSRSGATLRRLRPLVFPFVAYAAWITVVRLRVGYWPFAARANRLTFIPFSGLEHAIQHSSDRWTALAWIVIGLLVVASALGWGKRDEWYAIVVSFLVLAPFLGSDVWRRPADFGRVLLPLSAYSAALVLDAWWERGHRPRRAQVARYVPPVPAASPLR
ncbi:MAG: hypothetical protein ACLPVY_10710 [Acidimicrobiia bacterium]